MHSLAMATLQYESDISAQQSLHLATCTSLEAIHCLAICTVAVHAVFYLHSARAHMVTLPTRLGLDSVEAKIKHCVHELHTVCPRPLLPRGLVPMLTRYVYNLYFSRGA